MAKSLPQFPSITAEPVKSQNPNCRPKKSTIAFLRQFARVYTVVPTMHGPAAELIPN